MKKTFDELKAGDIVTLCTYNDADELERVEVHQLTEDAKNLGHTYRNGQPYVNVVTRYYGHDLTLPMNEHTTNFRDFLKHERQYDVVKVVSDDQTDIESRLKALDAISADLWHLLPNYGGTQSAFNAVLDNAKRIDDQRTIEQTTLSAIKHYNFVTLCERYKDKETPQELERLKDQARQHATTWVRERSYD